METRAQNTSDSNNSAEAGIRATSKSSSMIRRMSISSVTGFEVTKLPQTKTRRSSPPVAASSSSVRKRPDRHARLGDELQKRDWTLANRRCARPEATLPRGSTRAAPPHDNRWIGRRMLAFGRIVRAGPVPERNSSRMVRLRAADPACRREHMSGWISTQRGNTCRIRDGR